LFVLLAKEGKTMVEPLKVIHNGQHFREPLAARWAVFFEALGVRYEHEGESLEVDGLRYLPTFWMPEQQCWVEVKGQELTEEDDKKALLLAHHTRKHVYLFAGEIQVPDGKPVSPAYRYHWGESLPSIRIPPFRSCLASCHWCECPFCRQVTIEYDGLCQCQCVRHMYTTTYRLGFDEQSPKRLPHEAEDDYTHLDWWASKITGTFLTFDSPRLVAAYTAARQACFEDDERGEQR
jgi:hypothetical protein